MERKSLVQKLVKPQKMEGNLQSKQRGKPKLDHLANAAAEVQARVAEHPDATLMELCELFALSYRKLGESGSNVSLFTKTRAKSKKKHGIVAFAATERVQKLRVEYGEKIKDIDPKNERIFG